MLTMKIKLFVFTLVLLPIMTLDASTQEEPRRRSARIAALTAQKSDAQTARTYKLIIDDITQIIADGARVEEQANASPILSDATSTAEDTLAAPVKSRWSYCGCCRRAKK